jgi:CRISPR-associated endonuclease/helicase Cas3
MLQEIWAKKPKETLAEHTDYVVKNLLALKERYFEALPDEAFWQEAFIAALFHDLGKLSENFQDMIQPTRKVNWDNWVRHEFLSGMYLYVNSIDYYTKNPLSLFAVFSHHKILDKDLFNKNPHAKLRIKEQHLDDFLEYAKLWLTQYREIEFTFLAKAKRNLFNPYSTLLRQYQERFFRLSNDFKLPHRKQYVFYKAIMNIADWTASGHRELEPGLIYQKNFLGNQIISKLRKEGKSDIADNFKYRNFQEESYVEGNVLAVAPTGSGKTEASLLWASQKKEFEHIFYLLPTRVTSNAIFKRLCNYFGNEKVAIVHSSAFFLQKEIDENYPEKEYVFIDKAFFKNVTVCTIDQILTQGFNLGFWEVKTFHQLNSRIIIDEIHLYQPYTLGLIVATIEYLQNEFGAKFYIMTATMPEKLRTLLSRYLYEPNFIADTELLDKARNVFEIREELFDKMKPEIEKAIQEGKKVLLVLNTVDSAIQAYHDFKPLFENKEDKVLCYHSRFIQKHRGEKEKEIFRMEAESGGCLLVATQVVEVSLDIDFDILFTENAPIDAIIQRAGRVNRKRSKIDTKVVVFQHSEITEKYVYDLPNILKNTFTVLQRHNNVSLTEQQLLKLVDEVYQNYNVEEEPDFLKGLRRYAEIQHTQKYILDLKANEETFTRIGLDTVSVIPDKFQEKLMNESIMEKTKYEVSISKKRFDGLKCVKDEEHEWFKYVDVIYDLETGLKFKSKENMSEKSQSSKCW